MINRLLTGMFALLAFFASPAVAQEAYFQTVQRVFSGLYGPPGNTTQFAVIAYGNGTSWSPGPYTDSPSINNNNASSYNYATFRGTPTDHAEMRIMGYAEQMLGHLDSINVYTTLIPCTTCNALLVGFPAAHMAGRSPLVPMSLAYYLEYSQMTPYANYLSLVALQKAGWSVERVCPEGEQCTTFQTAVRDCIYRVPVICQYCRDRNDNDTRLVINTFAKLQSKDADAWAREILALGWANQAEGQQVASAVRACVAANQNTPVGTDPFSMMD